MHIFSCLVRHVKSTKWWLLVLVVSALIFLGLGLNLAQPQLGASFIDSGYSSLVQQTNPFKENRSRERWLFTPLVYWYTKRRENVPERNYIDAQGNSNQMAMHWPKKEKRALERISVSYKDTMTIPLLRWSGGSSKVTTSGEITPIIAEYT